MFTLTNIDQLVRDSKNNKCEILKQVCVLPFFFFFSHLAGKLEWQPGLFIDKTLYRTSERKRVPEPRDVRAAAAESEKWLRNFIATCMNNTEH